MPKYVFSYTLSFPGEIIVEADSQDDAFEQLDKGIADWSIDLEQFVGLEFEDDDWDITPYEGTSTPVYNWTTPDPVFEPLQTESLFELIDTNV